LNRKDAAAMTAELRRIANVLERLAGTRSRLSLLAELEQEAINRKPQQVAVKLPEFTSGRRNGK